MPAVPSCPHHRPRDRPQPVTESSVALPPDVGDCIMMVAFHRPPCPKCKATATLARITPGRSGFDIRTFECRACDHIYQRVVALVDPMNHGLAPRRITRANMPISNIRSPQLAGILLDLQSLASIKRS